MFWSGNDVEVLISKKKYAKAIKVLRAQLNEEKSAFKQQQLADLLALEGHTKEAVHILSKLVEEFAGKGFLTKAIAILKKIKRIQPDLEGLEEKVAELIRKRSESETEGGQEQKEEERIKLSEHTPMTGGSEPLPISGVPVTKNDAVGALAESHSPLFRDFSTQELTAFITGLDLSIYEPGQIVFSEGEPGNCLYVLASGSLRVYVRDAQGHNEEVRSMGVGEFFGEISLLSGQPRTATIITASHCELLALDIKALTNMAKNHPAIPNMIREVARLRHNSPEERSARHMDQGSAH